MTLEQRIVGTWRLESWDRVEDDGRRWPRFGSGFSGLLTYTADGFMFAALQDGNRKPFSGPDPYGGTAEECKAAMSTGHSYCGRWRLEGDAILHDVELSVFPNWVGSEQIRYVRFDGDRMVLRTPPTLRRGSTGYAELIWRRA
ncbi:MAG: lipocalin-like domain-containing protein [Alphaproteobacteria bacterium]|nr:lipocalin-like domain-containing protein [Alphaproteobacteria bacterium]